MCTTVLNNKQQLYKFTEKLLLQITLDSQIFPVTGPYTELRVVTASSVADGEHMAWRTLDTLTETLWRSQPQTRPWLAVDLISSHLVLEVAFSESDDIGCVTHDIEVRVGFGRPFQHNTGGETVYQHNRVCGLFAGPGAPFSRSVVTCTGN